MVVLGTHLPESVREVLNDPVRLRALAALDEFDGAPDSDFDRLSRMAAHIFGAEIALVSLVGEQRQWVRSSFGTTAAEIGGEFSFAAQTLTASKALVVLDASLDERFKSHPQVLGSPNIRFYAGAPIVVGGERLGSLCVISTQPRADVDDQAIEQLGDIAALASSLFSLKDEARVRARTAAALMREEWRHALTLEAGKVGSWVWDIGTGEVACNDTFRRMYDLPETGVIRVEQILDATHASERARVEEALQESLTHGTDYSSEARVATSARWLAMRGRVYQRDAEGRPLVMMGASIDTTESKQNAEQMRMLLRELNHRVKNTLAMIQSVARQTIRQNPNPRAFLEAFTGRLRTISEAHVLLADRDWSGVQLYEVVASQLGPNFLTRPDRAKVQGEDVMLPPDHALGLGLILHELTTNAHRHGAWASSMGVVEIDWEIAETPEPGLKLHWREKGGPAVSKPDEYGLGARLIERSLAKVLDSEVELSFDPAGVSATIWLPLPS